MRYQGGKSKIAKKLATAIGSGETLFEPFCGGGAMTAAPARAWKPIEVYDVFRYGEHYLKYNFRGESKREWRWRIKARNGKIIAASSEGFSSRAKCLANLNLTMNAFDGCERGPDGISPHLIRDLTAGKPAR